MSHGLAACTPTARRGLGTSDRPVSGLSVDPGVTRIAFPSARGPAVAAGVACVMRSYRLPLRGQRRPCRDLRTGFPFNPGHAPGHLSWAAM